MELNRRQFFEVSGKGTLGSAALLATAGGSVFVLEGCNALDELTTWMPVGLSAFDSIVSLINPIAGSVLAVSVSTADSLWNAVSTAIANYQHTSDPTTTLLDKVIAALDALQGGLTQVLSAIPVSLSGAILLAVKGGFALLLATLKSIQGKLEPKVSANAKVMLKASRSPELAAAIGTTAPAKNKADFVSQFNAIMAANGQTVRLK
jgi:hypothetical protein